jgi:GntR family transcriptional regulator
MTARQVTDRREPTYRVLAEELRSGVAGGRFPEGTRLPTEAELSRTYGVSRQTVRRAYQDLVADGVVERVQGRGTFALPRREYLRSFGSVEDLLALSLDTELQILDPITRRENPHLAALLGLQFDDVIEVQFRRSHQGGAFCVTAVALPPWVGEPLLNHPALTVAGSKSRVTILGLLDNTLSSPISGAKQVATAVACPPEVAPVLECEVGAPVLTVTRTYFDADGRAVEHATNYFNPDRYSYRLQLQRARH